MLRESSKGFKCTMIYTQKTDNTELTDVFYNYGNTYLERNLNSVDYIVKLFVGTNLLMKSFIFGPFCLE